MKNNLEEMRDLLSDGQIPECLTSAREILHHIDKNSKEDLNHLWELLSLGFGGLTGSGLVDFVNLLEKEGFDFGMRWPDQRGGLALVFAQSGCYDLPTFFRLTQLGMDTGLFDGAGNTILHHLAAQDKCGKNKKVGPFGAALITSTEELAPWIRPNAYGATPLHLAALHGHLEIIRAFLGRGVDPDIYGSAAAKGFYHTMDLNQVTPLHLACSMGNPELVRLLLSYGADPARTDTRGHNACFYAIDNPDKLYCPAFYHSVPSCQAVIRRKCMILRQLGNVDRTDRDGNTPLMYALSVFSGDRGGYGSYLLGLGADPNHRNHQGRTPLMLAVTGRNPETARKLLKAGAVVNYQDPDGNTPLHLAVLSGSGEAVQKLIETLLLNGADPELDNKEEKSALDLAREKGMEQFFYSPAAVR